MRFKLYPENYQILGKDINNLQRQFQQEMIVDIAGAAIAPTNAGKLVQIGEGMMPVRLIRITASTLISGKTSQWSYDIEIVKIKADLTVVATELVGTAINLVELMNPATTGLQGNGVDTSAADWPTGYDVQPAPDDLITIGYKLDGLSDYGYVFAYENGVDGSCS